MTKGATRDPAQGGPAPETIDPEEALARLNAKLAKLRPDDLEGKAKTLFSKAQLLLLIGRELEARSCFEMIDGTQLPHKVSAWVDAVCAMLAAQAGEAEQALRRCELLDADDLAEPAAGGMWLDALGLLAADGAARDVLDVMDEVEREGAPFQGPLEPWARTLRWRARLMLGEASEVAREVEAAAGGERAPLAAAAWIFRAGLAALAGEAPKVGEAVAAAAGKIPAEGREALASWAAGAARVATQSDKPEAAVLLLDAVRAQAEKDGWAVQARAFVDWSRTHHLQVMARFEEAEKVYLTLPPPADPGGAGLLFGGRAWCELCRGGDAERAGAWSEQARMARPESRMAHMALGAALVVTGRDVEAGVDLLKWWLDKKEPARGAARWWRAFELAFLARGLEKLGRADEAAQARDAIDGLPHAALAREKILAAGAATAADPAAGATPAAGAPGATPAPGG